MSSKYFTVRKKVSIYSFELFCAQVARWAIFQEALVPGLDLLLRESGVLAQILQHFRLQFTILLAHFS